MRYQDPTWCACLGYITLTMTLHLSMLAGVSGEKTDVSRLLQKAILDGRSEIYRWLWQHYDELAAVLNAPRAPWSALSRAIRESGNWSAGSSGPTRQAVRDAWLRVERTKQQQRPKTPKPASVAYPRPQPAPDDDDGFIFPNTKPRT
jgi:hypothetical protein